MYGQVSDMDKKSQTRSIAPSASRIVHPNLDLLCALRRRHLRRRSARQTSRASALGLAGRRFARGRAGLVGPDRRSAGIEGASSLSDSDLDLRGRERPRRGSWRSVAVTVGNVAAFVQLSQATRYQQASGHRGRRLQASAKTNIRFMFHAMVTRLHSPWTLSSPRSRNWRKPITDLMIPNTGSGVCLRKA
jgi:hypothetical protein